MITPLSPLVKRKSFPQKVSIIVEKYVKKLKELIRACEELEVNNRNYTNSIHFENQINESRYYK